VRRVARSRNGVQQILSLFPNFAAKFDIF